MKIKMILSLILFLLLIIPLVSEELDDQELFKKVEKLALSGDIEAQYNTGRCYEEGFGTEKNGAKAMSWYNTAAQQGHMEAQFRLACLYDFGENVLHNNVQAVKWYTMAAEQGKMEAQYNLAICYEDGNGVEQDFQEAYKYYLLTCNFASGGLYESAEANLSLAAEQLTASQIEAATDEVNSILGNR